MKLFNELHCFHCEIDFVNTPQIIDHFKIEHETEVFICDDCNQVYLSPEARRKHQQKVHKAVSSNHYQIHCPDRKEQCKQSIPTINLLQNSKKNDESARDAQAQEKANTDTVKSTEATVNQAVSCCLSSVFEAKSRESLQNHFNEQHNQPASDMNQIRCDDANGVRLEMSTTLDIKREMLDFLYPKYDEIRAGPTWGAFMDLTDDD